SLRRLVLGLGTAQVVLTGMALALYCVFLGTTWNQASILGLGLALSSTAFVLQLLEERGDTDSASGRAAFAILLLQDLAIVPLLALVPLVAQHEAAPGEGSLASRAATVAAALVGVIVIGRYVVTAVLHRLEQRGNREAFAMVAVAAVIGAAWAML